VSVDDLTAPAETAPPTPAAAGVSGHGMVQALRVLVPVVIVFCTLGGLAWHAGHPLTNTDTYFHLRFGAEFLHGNWSLRNPGSVTSFGTNDWVPTQWLPQVVMAQTEDWFGLAGVAWLQGLLHLSLAVALWLLARPYAGAFRSAVLVALALLAASPGLSMRPQVLSYLFAAIVTAAWLRSRDDGKARWWLIPLSWVWAMCHGMWPVGIVIGAVAVIGIALDRVADRRTLLKLAAVPVGSAVAAALTPVGPALYPAVLMVGSRGKYFAEWQPANFLRLAGGALIVLAGIVLVRLLRRGFTSSWTETLLFGLALGWALYTTRTVAIAAMMLVPIGARVLGNGTGKRQRVPRGEMVAVLTGAAVCLVALAVAVPRTADNPPPDPSWASTLDDLPPGTAVVNDWGKGGWFIYRWPDLDFVMNGYGDIFTDGELARNYQIDATNPGWAGAVQRTGARYALLKPGSRLAYSLEELEGWTEVQRSADLVLLKAPPSWPDLS
jgi:hypothetical protein